ncbi:Ribonucleoside-diphosphate reductase large subunit [Camellia lanceoleosa]|uniref:Ribonucleoside-diphosphate reductase large subunit n=1 Tax=Camellia lanceoleosa TaxID=1840588 RepID=A0ACC0F326_9ERIC|nr:Ribonucleoside-diphosphate reductase large subunit [Camellia lanceoleosa]
MRLLMFVVIFLKLALTWTHYREWFVACIARLKKLSYCLSIDHCDPILVFQKVYASVYNGITTNQLDELSTKTADAMTTNHPNYASMTTARNQSNREFNFKRPLLAWKEEELQRLLDVIGEGSALRL